GPSDRSPSACQSETALSSDINGAAPKIYREPCTAPVDNIVEKVPGLAQNTSHRPSSSHLPKNWAKKKSFRIRHLHQRVRNTQWRRDRASERPPNVYKSSESGAVPRPRDRAESRSRPGRTAPTPR